MEEQITFNAHTDRMVYGVSDNDGEMLIEISGYDLSTKFNLDRLHSLEDAENACMALANVFVKALCEQLLDEHKNNQ